MKLRSQTTSWILALVFLGVAGLFPLLAVTNVVGNDPLRFRQDSYVRLNFMEAILTTMNGIANLGVIIIAVLIGTVIGSEYGQDTWKNLLTWQKGRVHFLVAKLAVAVPLLLGAIILTELLAGLFASIGHWLVADTALKAGLTENTRTTDQFYKDLYTSGLPVLLHFLAVITITTFFTVLGRSTIVGIMVTVVWWIGENISLRLLPDVLKNLTLTTNINSLGQNLSDGKGSIGVWQSLLAIVAYIVIPLVAALIIFEQRDIAG